MADDWLFPVDPLLPRKDPNRLNKYGRPVSKRTIALDNIMRSHLMKMHAEHGHGPAGETCRHCEHLMGNRMRSGRVFLKCERYNAGGYESTDWRAKWPACGAFKKAP